MTRREQKTPEELTQIAKKAWQTRRRRAAEREAMERREPEQPVDVLRSWSDQVLEMLR